MTEPTPPAAPTPYTAPAGGYAPAAKWNVLSIVSLVTSVLGFSIVGIITGHISLSQIKKTGEQGNVLAIIGLVIGYLGALGWIIFWIVWIGILAAAGAAGGFSSY
jgi:hypothetical protein